MWLEMTLTLLTRRRCLTAADAYPDAAMRDAYVHSTDILRDALTGKNSDERLTTGVNLSVQRGWSVANPRRRQTCGGGGNSDVICRHVTQDLSRVASDRPLSPALYDDVITHRRLLSSSAAFIPSSRSRTTTPTGHKGAHRKYFICFYCYRLILYISESSDMSCLLSYIMTVKHTAGINS